MAVAEEGNVPDNIKRMLDKEAPAEKVDSNAPIYRIMPDTRIPVSKHFGKLWKGRVDSTKRYRQFFEEAWDEADKYYNNNQLSHRNSKDGASGNTYYARRRNEQWSETENIVFSNIKSLVPAIYAKNPRPEITILNDDFKELGPIVEKVVYTLSQMDHAPGINLKPIAKQTVVHALLTNCAWVESGWTFKEMSSQFAIEEINRIGKELEKAKGENEIRELEGQLMALEGSIDMLSPEGPFTKNHPAKRVLVDCDASMPDFSDARWMAIYEVYPTDYLNAVYGKKKGDQYMSVYKPTHVLMAKNAGSKDEDLDSFKLFDTNADAQSYGYASPEAYRKAWRTCCYRIWDKTLRRVYLFAENDWDWPVWVWNDPYQLPRFFPLRSLAFHTASQGAYALGEVTYYLDQQDAINEIVDEERRARMLVKNKIFYDLNKMSRDDMDTFLKGPDRLAMGIDVPDGKTAKDVIFAIAPPSLEFPQLFNKSEKLASIDRISGVGIILRNEEFKTNTTNQAIAKYESSTQTRLDERLDAVEDFIGGVYWDVAFLCMRFMKKQQVAEIIGFATAEKWQEHLSPQQITTSFNMRCVGGSTLKPTSMSKKREIVEMMQALGQFAGAVKGSTIVEIALRLMTSAFETIEITQQDIDRLRQEAAMTLGAGSSGEGAETANASTPNAEGEGALPAEAVLVEVARFIDGLPPNAKMALGTLTARGVPAIEAFKEIVQAVSTGPEQESAEADTPVPAA